MTVQIVENLVSSEYAKEVREKGNNLLVQSDRRVHYYEIFGAKLPPLGFEEQDQSSQIFSSLDSEEDKRGMSLILNSMHLAKREIEKFYNVNIDIFEGGLVKIVEGGYNRLHADRYRLDGSAWNDGLGREDECQYSAIFYMSDHGEHFEGGEIIFPQHETRVEPKSGTLVFFPGDINHIHKVNKITSGERFAIVMFMGYRDQPESN